METEMEKKGLKVKNQMYTQFIDHLPCKNVEKLEEIVKKKIKPDRYALILHDKDSNEDGKQTAPHVHLMMTFENPRYITNIAKLLGDKTQYIESYNNGKTDERNGFSYLLHRTKNSKNKFQYDTDDIRSNFDFDEYIKNAKKEITKAEVFSVKNLLDQLYLGLITKKDIEDTLSGSQYARNKRQIEEVHAKMLENKAKEWRKQALANNIAITSVWITGQSGVGKSSLAKEYAQKSGNDYFMTGSSRDLFQGYSGERTLIIDEFRVGIVEYSDLLKILDPYGISNTPVMLPSRYTDKSLCCDTIIITSPYDPHQFYTEMVARSKINEKIDKFNQLQRRITITIKMTNDYIYLMEYDFVKKEYRTIQSTKQKNKYSGKQRQALKKDPREIYKNFIDL